MSVGRFLLPAIYAGLLSGCALAPEQLPPPAAAPVDAAQRLPPVAVFRKASNAMVESRCAKYGKASPIRECLRDQVNVNSFQQALERTGRFESVVFAGREVPYKIAYSMGSMDAMPVAESVAKGVVAGASLLVVPIVGLWDAEVEIEVFWGRTSIAEYTYEFRFEPTVSLFHRPADEAAKFADRVVGAFLEDAERDGLFRPQSRARLIESSDYFTDLRVPERIGSYTRSAIELLPEVMLGAVVHYQHPVFLDQFLDIFVYPIPRTDWSDSAEVGREETVKAQKEIELVARERGWAEPEFSAIRQVEIGSDTVNVFDGVVPVDETQTRASRTHLLVRKDKFVMIRETGSTPVDDDAVAEAIKAIQVPEESLLLMRLRQQAR